MMINRFAKAAIALCAGIVAAVPALAEAIQPGGDIQERLQEALILAEPGDTIELAEGVFEFTMGLSLDVDGVTLQGAGPGKTILSFKNQNAGSEGLIVTSDDIVLRDFAIEDSIGDAIKAKGSDTISFLNVRTEWTGGPKPTNGAYGFYPVESKNVLVDGCEAVGASDAGIYVGQCDGVVVRNSIARFNVAGIEIENCYNADVYNNVATRNTGGILVFDLPNLPQQGGHSVRVFDNKIVDNDTENFAPEGNIVGYVPTGSGLIVMANRDVRVFENEFSGNDTAHVLIRSFMPYGDREAVDANYYPHPRNVYIHSNDFGPGGRKPMGVRGELFAEAAKAGGTLPDIVWDGIRDETAIAAGKLGPDHGIYIDQPGATFVNLDITNYLKDPKSSKPTTDIAVHKGSLPDLPPVKLPQDDS